MRFVPLDVMFNLVLPFADGVSQEFARRQIMRAARTLCIESCVWQAPRHAHYKHCDCDGMLAFHDFEEADIIKVMSVDIEGRRIQELKDSDLNEYDYSVGTPGGYVTVGLNKIHLIGKPSGDVRINALCAIAPKLHIKEFPEFLYQRYAEPISYGALSLIKQAEGQPFSDPQKAVYYEAKFINGVREARVEAHRSMGRFTGRVRGLRIV